MIDSYRKSRPRKVFYLSTAAHVLCLDQATGETVWKTKLPGVGWGATQVTILLYRDRIFGCCTRSVACLDRADGTVQWATKLKKLSQPVGLALDESVPGGMLVVTGAGRVYGVSADQGHEIWHNELSGLGYSPVTLRVPHAVVAQPRVALVGGGKSAAWMQRDNDQTPAQVEQEAPPEEARPADETTLPPGE